MRRRTRRLARAFTCVVVIALVFPAALHQPDADAAGFSCSVTNNADGSTTISWDDLGANGYDVVEDGAPAIWVTATSRTDYSPGTSYTIIAWATAPTEQPLPAPLPPHRHRVATQ